MENIKVIIKNGQIDVICSYVNGNLNGEYKLYYANSKLSFICNYIDNKINEVYDKN